MIASLLVVVILLFALCGDLMPAVITPCNAQQSSAEAENWEDDRRDIQRVQDKVNRKGLISKEDYKIINDNLDGAVYLESFISSVDSLTVEIDLGEVYRLKSFAVISRIAKRAFGNERMNIYITRKDGSNLNFSIIIKNAGIAEFNIYPLEE